jgi:hypothetical protein
MKATCGTWPPVPSRHHVTLSAVAVAVLSALAAGLGSPFAILREITRVVLGTAATMAVLSALAAGFGSLLAVLGKIARVAVFLRHVYSAFGVDALLTFVSSEGPEPTTLDAEGSEQPTTLRRPLLSAAAGSLARLFRNGMWPDVVPRPFFVRNGSPGLP